MVTGSCICSAVEFEIEGDDFEVIQCHCSKCRKITGSTADAMIVVPAEEFFWRKGTDAISTYKFENGSVRSFCSCCGDTLPNQDGQVYWVPAGILDSAFSARVTAHIFVGSKLPWEEIGGNAPQYDERLDNKI